MALHAPAHREIAHALDARHRADVAVARSARDVRSHVRVVIEMDVARENVDLHPRDLLMRVPVLPHLHDLRAVWIDGAVASHAALHGRNAGKRRSSRAAVTEITAQG